MSAVWYRVEDYRVGPPLDEWERPIGRGTARVHMRQLPLVKETAKGVWLDDYGQRRFVRAVAKKQYACPSKEEALASFRARKERQLSILRAQIAHVETALRRAAAGEVTGAMD